MKCKLCEDKLLEYLYGELGEEDAAAMERHLEASDACRQAYEGFASVLETVAEEGEEGPSPALHTRIMGHAEEARPARRSLWAWVFRPAVTTAVIGAVAAGVYFTSLRHKPPSLLNERILSGESLVRETKQRSTPPSSMAKVDALKKEAKEKGFLTRLAEPHPVIEQEEVASEPFEVAEKKGSASDAMPPEEDRAATGGVEGATPPTHETRQEPMALSASRRRSPAYEAAPVPPAIEQALELVSEGRCAEAGKAVEIYRTENPEEQVSGVGWLGVARCHEKKGNTRAAREFAEKALKIPAYKSEARNFLDSLPPPAE